MHVATDVFCSASLVLPDRGGRQLNVGGWNYDSVWGLRLYLPDGSPGQPSVNDWDEDYNEIHLEAARWYPTAMSSSSEILFHVILQCLGSTELLKEHVSQSKHLPFQLKHI